MKRLIYTTAGRVLLAMLLAALSTGLRPGDGIAQSNPATAEASSSETPASDRAAEWTWMQDDTKVDWPGGAPDRPVSDVRPTAEAALDRLRARGYYFARLDSARVDTSTTPPRVQVYAHRGPLVSVTAIRFEGVSVFTEEDLRRELETAPGAPLKPSVLDRDVQTLLRRYEDAGYPLAQIRVRPRIVTTPEGPGLDLTVAVEAGPTLVLQRIAVTSRSSDAAARTTDGFVERVTDVDLGEPLTGYDPEEIRRRLLQTGFYTSVGTPRLTVDPKGGAALEIPVSESDPGVFDLVLGYLPPSGGREGQLVGTGRLDLENPFGRGRTGTLRLDRRPGQVSLFDASLSDPYVFGLPLRVSGQFRGEQRDSTFGERAFGGSVGYRLGEGLEATVSVQREVTRPGAAGTAFRGNQQRIPRAEALFYGAGLGVTRVDRIRNPRRGVRLDVTVEQGTKRRRFAQIAEGDTLRIDQSLRQERITGRVRGYVPVQARQVVAMGADASLIFSDAYDRSDLFFFGGANTLRGYDEDQFLGNAVGRLLVEYRLLIDRVSYAYVFADGGYVERPAVDDTPSRTEHLLGYGIGLQFGSALGVVDVNYALNRSDVTPANGRIHVGLRFGL